MTSFDDVLSQLVTRLRRSPAAGFVPHASPRPPERKVRDAPKSHGSALPLNSYREVYGCAASTWGADAGWTPDTAPLAATPATPCRSVPRSASSPRRSATIPFRVFDEP